MLAIKSIGLLCCVSLSACFAGPNAAGATPEFHKLEPGLFAGGVAGIADLLDSSHSTQFRAAGGGLYLHTSGWQELTSAEQGRLIQTFGGSPIAIEMGFGSGEEWGKFYAQHYLVYGIKPTFIAANAFAHNNHPTVEQWRNYITRLRASGVPASSLILPTFEYQNFKPNIPTLAENKISLSPIFQEIAESAGGLVIDTPSGYAMKREQAYRDWIIDAIQWAARLQLTSVILLSPGSSGTHWAEDTDRYIDYLRAKDAIPSDFVCENYEPPGSPSDYPNRVGDENVAYTTLGVCQLLMRRFPPKPN